MTEPAILVNQVQKAFGAVPVLQNVSFSVPAGETFALLGRNGAGKTTLIRMMLGLTAPDQGELQIAGYNPRISPLELRQHVGYLAEDQRMYGWMKAGELCRFLQPFYPSWDEALAADYLDRFEIPRTVKIHKLSKGQGVKLGLAVALAHRPAVAILDDPVLGLDPIARKEFNRDLIEHLQAAGRTVLYSSHLLAEVEVVADRIAILDQGRIVRAAPTDELREQVKQIELPADAAAELVPPETLLDVRREDDTVLLTVDRAAEFLEFLVSRGIEHRVQDLNLDEIFEAFVMGRPHGWPLSGPAKTRVGIS